MNYSKIDYCDMVNGPGFRISLFVSGCRNHCQGCFNPSTWDFNAGKLYTNNQTFDILARLSKRQISGLSILGGDPFEPENIEQILKLCKAIKIMYYNKTIWLWTGYKYQNFKQHQIMKYIDVLVDGKFQKNLADITLKYVGSSNQRVIDVKKSQQSNSIVLFDC